MHDIKDKYYDKCWVHEEFFNPGVPAKKRCTVYVAHCD